MLLVSSWEYFIGKIVNKRNELFYAGKERCILFYAIKKWNENKTISVWWMKVGCDVQYDMNRSVGKGTVIALGLSTIFEEVENILHASIE